MLFFFFKQKTAYEMRISDWSSDVCSSDLSGYLPALVRNGFRGKIYCTPATFELCGLLLPDSGHLQEEEARYAQRKGYSRHAIPKPLYTQEDARSEEHTSELQSLMRISYAVFCLKKKTKQPAQDKNHTR